MFSFDSTVGVQQHGSDNTNTSVVNTGLVGGNTAMVDQH
jgi:hypothetical protein